jgi:hypothetical protein
MSNLRCCIFDIGTWGHTPDSLEALRYHKQRFQKTQVGALLDFVRVSPFIPVYESNTSFLDLMLLLGKFQVRRVYRVESPSGDINGVLSQSAIVDVLSSNMSRFPSISQKSIVDLGLGTPSNVISVDLHDTYWDAFRAINAHVSVFQLCFVAFSTFLDLADFSSTVRLFCFFRS